MPKWVERGQALVLDVFFIGEVDRDGLSSQMSASVLCSVGCSARVSAFLSFQYGTDNQ